MIRYFARKYTKTLFAHTKMLTKRDDFQHVHIACVEKKTWCFVEGKKIGLRIIWADFLSSFIFLKKNFDFFSKNFYALGGNILLLVVIPKENNTKSYFFKRFFFSIFLFLHNIDPSTKCNVRFHVVHVVTKISCLTQMHYG